MIGFFRPLALFLAAVLLSGCGYRFVDPFPASDYALVSVRNATPEPGLAPLLEQELLQRGGFRDRSENRLSVSITAFSERVESVGSDGRPLRQKVTLDVAWRIEGPQTAQGTFGKEKVERSYPWTDIPETLEWNRNAAIRLLAEGAARVIVQRLGGAP